MQSILFGTDGWRAKIGEGFDFESVGRVMVGLHEYLTKQNKRAKIIVGYDCRELSPEAAQFAAAWLASQGHQVSLSDKPVPTPAVALVTKENIADMGVMVTASHNPPGYNGIKFKGSYGGSVDEKVAQAIATHIPASPPVKLSEALSFSQQHVVKCQQKDLAAQQVKALLRYIGPIDLSLLKVVVDPMFGSSQGIFTAMIRQLGAEVIEIRGSGDITFGGHNPEPLKTTTTMLQQTVVETSAHLGFAFDGDGDRIAAVDDKGQFVDSHQIFSLLLLHQVNHRRQTGKVVKTQTTTHMIDKLCQQLNLPLVTTPVGFKHICHHMITEPVLMGGEESGGIGFPAYLPERDAMLCALFMCELLQVGGKLRLSDHLTMLYEKVGLHCYRRFDMSVAGANAKPLVNQIAVDIKNQQPKIAEQTIEKMDTSDGLKCFFNDGWLMLRGSGTEPLLRIYAEASADDRVERYIEAGKFLASSALER